MRLAIPLVALTLAGCGTERSLMPLEVGIVSRYEVEGGFNHFIGEAKVVRKAAVAGLDGYVISGPMGETRLAWRGDTLIGERFSNTRFDPAIPLAVAREGRVRKEWRGTVEGFWGRFEGKAVLDQGPVGDAAGRKLKRVKSLLTVEGPKGKSIKLETEFEPGIGIVSQSQAISSNSVLKITRLGGS